jgi:hypothetical protein
MTEESSEISDEQETPSTSSVISYSEYCSSGSGINWIRRIPVDKEGFLIRILDSPTTELLV